VEGCVVLDGLVNLVRKVGCRWFEGQDDCRGPLLKYVDICGMCI
jgi:hypothetical protein